MRLSKFLLNLNEVVIDNENGLGHVPDNQEIDYKGLRVKMKPSVFLKLARQLDTPKDSLKLITTHIINNGAIGAPLLMIELPVMAWEDYKLSIPAKVVGHEGRHRMMSILNVEGDIPIETHLFFSGGLRARHLKPEWIENIRKQMFPEMSSTAISGNLFDQ